MKKLKDVNFELVSTSSIKLERASFTDYKLGRIVLSKHLAISLVGSLDVSPSYARQLLLREPSDFPSGRVPIFVCELCGDLACGAVVVRVEAEGECFVWSEFGYESPYSDKRSTNVIMDRIGPFRFDAEVYRAALSAYT